MRASKTAKSSAWFAPQKDNATGEVVHVALKQIERNKMQKVNVVLDEEQQMELQMILADQDKEAALLFLKQVIWEQVQSSNRKALRGHLEKGAS
jgi:hypothetical protein